MRVVTPTEALGVETLPLALSVAQAATLLGVSKQTLYRAINAGEWEALTVNGRLVIPTRPLLAKLGYNLDGNQEPPGASDGNARKPAARTRSKAPPECLP